MNKLSSNYQTDFLRIQIRFVSVILLVFALAPHVFGQYSAPVSASTGSGNGNTAVGDTAGNSASTGSYNAFFGSNSGRSQQGGIQNAFFGNGSGFSNTGGTNNCFFGQGAGQNNTNGPNNSFFGQWAGLSNTTSAQNSIFGTRSGFNLSSGGNNSIFGAFAAFNMTTGTNNIIVGYDTAEHLLQGSNNIIIGKGAGPSQANTNVDSKLYIDVVIPNISGDDNPLIYGEFDNNFVKINGTFEVTAGLSNPSSRLLKNHFKTIDATETLNKLASMEIQQWTYKHRSDEKHIGPVAEEFYELFELGEGNTKISTIDADGVMMLSIQALKMENDDLRNEVKELKSLVSSLIEKIEK